MPRHRPHVTVVGLGPAGTDLVSPGVADLLAAAPGRAYLRTARHPAAARFDGVPAFDHLYEAAATFDEVYAGIVEALVAAAIDAAPEAVVYAVPGSPLVAERTRGPAAGRRPGRGDRPARPLLLGPGLGGVGHRPPGRGGAPGRRRRLRLRGVGPGRPVPGGAVLVAPPAFGGEAGRLRRVEDEDDDGPALPRPVLLHHLGLDDEVVAEVDWWDLDRTVEPDHLTSLYIPGPVPTDGPSAGAEAARLVALMDTLRERCPWDRAQTHGSLMPHLIEESYEVLDALAEVDGPEADAAAYAHLEEELGDLLFQIVFHARLADEAGYFDLAGVAGGVHDKLVHRHPHVFGDVDVDTADQVVTNWEAIKKSEKGRSSVTEGIPAALPALMLATKLARKARAVGLEPDDATAGETAARLAALIRRAEGTDPQPDDPLSTDAGELHRALGELLFAVANLAQRLGVDAEQALRDRALSLRADILAAEGVPEPQVGNR